MAAQRLDSSFTLRPLESSSSVLPLSNQNYHHPDARYSATSSTGWGYGCHHHYPSTTATNGVNSVVVQFQEHCHRRRHLPYHQEGGSIPLADAHHDGDNNHLDDDDKSLTQTKISPNLKRRLFHDEDPLPIVSSASPTIRAAPFQRFVHERNLPRNGTISTKIRTTSTSSGLHYHSNNHHQQQQQEKSQHLYRYFKNPPSTTWNHHQQQQSNYFNEQDEEDDHHRRRRRRIADDDTQQRAAFEPPPMERMEHWKRQCFHLQATLNDTRRSMEELRQDHRQLQRRFERLEKDLYHLSSSSQRNKSNSNVLNDRQRRRQQQHQKEQDESSPVSDLSASHASDKESTLLASAAKAVTQDDDVKGYDDGHHDEEEFEEKDEEEEDAISNKKEQLPTGVVHVPKMIRLSRFIGIVADTEELSEDEDDDGDIFSYYAESSISEEAMTMTTMTNHRQEKDNEPYHPNKDKEEEELLKISSSPQT